MQNCLTMTNNIRQIRLSWKQHLLLGSIYTKNGVIWPVSGRKAGVIE